MGQIGYVILGGVLSLPVLFLLGLLAPLNLRIVRGSEWRSRRRMIVRPPFAGGEAAETETDVKVAA